MYITICICAYVLIHMCICTSMLHSYATYPRTYVCGYMCLYAYVYLYGFEFLAWLLSFRFESIPESFSLLLCYVDHAHVKICGCMLSISDSLANCS